MSSSQEKAKAGMRSGCRARRASAMAASEGIVITSSATSLSRISMYQPMNILKKGLGLKAPGFSLKAFCMVLTTTPRTRKSCEARLIPLAAGFTASDSLPLLLIRKATSFTKASTASKESTAGWLLGWGSAELRQWDTAISTRHVKNCSAVSSDLRKPPCCRMTSSAEACLSLFGKSEIFAHSSRM